MLTSWSIDVWACRIAKSLRKIPYIGNSDLRLVMPSRLKRGAFGGAPSVIAFNPSAAPSAAPASTIAVNPSAAPSAAPTSIVAVNPSAAPSAAPTSIVAVSPSPHLQRRPRRLSPSTHPPRLRQPPPLRRRWTCMTTAFDDSRLVSNSTPPRRLGRKADFRPLRRRPAGRRDRPTPRPRRLCRLRRWSTGVSLRERRDVAGAP